LGASHSAVCGLPSLLFFRRPSHRSTLHLAAAQPPASDPNWPVAVKHRQRIEQSQPLVGNNKGSHRPPAGLERTERPSRCCGLRRRALVLLREPCTAVGHLDRPVVLGASVRLDRRRPARDTRTSSCPASAACACCCSRRRLDCGLGLNCPQSPLPATRLLLQRWILRRLLHFCKTSCRPLFCAPAAICPAPNVSLTKFGNFCWPFAPPRLSSPPSHHLLLSAVPSPRESTATTGRLRASTP
ncbi:hypothetical protein QBC47DRAFT_9116, partial [Echria macrotheca]